MTSPTLKNLFDLLINACDAEGGDGDVKALSSNPNKLADLFDIYCAEAGINRWQRGEQDGIISYWGGNQEAIYFAVLDDTRLDYCSLTVSFPYDTYLT